MIDDPLHELTAGIYIDEFSEHHSKDMLVRERVDRCIPAAGVGCVVAESFARIFYRNAFNTGLVLVESGAAAGGYDAVMVQSKAKTVKDYLAELPADRRAAKRSPRASCCAPGRRSSP